MKIRLNSKQLTDLTERFTQSKVAVPIIVQALLKDKLKQRRNELRPRIPTDTGALRNALNSWAHKRRSAVEAGLAFMRGKGITAGTAIASNVLQHPGANPKKGNYLWIPLHRTAMGPTISPRQLLDSGGFIKTSKAGNKIAFMRTGDDIEPYFILRKFVRFKEAPLPIAEAGTRVADETAKEIPMAVIAIIEGRQKFVAGYNG